MKCFLWSLVIFFGVLSPTLASKLYAQSATHAYWLCRHQQCVFISDRATGKLVKKECIIDPQAIQLYEGKVYILSQTKYPYFIILDQKTHQVLRAVNLKCEVQDFVLYKGNAYFIWRYRREISQFDLKEEYVSKVFKRDASITSISIHKDKMYLTTNLEILEILNLSDLGGHYKLVDLGINVIDFHISRGRGWAIPVGSGEVIELNLKTLKIEKRIHVDIPVQDAVILGKDLYVFQSRYSTVYIIDLDSGSLVTDSWQYNSDSYASDQGVFTHSIFSNQYTMLRKIVHLKELGVVLFDASYSGITGSLWGEGDEEFEAMCIAIEEEDFLKAHAKFHEALGYCHPKAYAIAAFAFMQGKLGAEKNIHLGFEFWTYCDKDYYEHLSYNLAEEGIALKLTQNIRE